jgi:hypothetical protein
VLDAYAEVSLFTTNPEFFSHNAFFPATLTQSQKPTVSFDGHLSYAVKRRLWISLDGNFWHGGSTSLNGVENPATVQTRSGHLLDCNRFCDRESTQLPFNAFVFVASL